jgi:excisionase family DNA binding protein
MFITLGQAAKQLGVSKSTLSKYIHQGKLSAQKQADGSYRIDPAELDRVRTVLRPHPEPSAEHSDTPVDTRLIQQELDRLRDLLVERERTLAERDRRIEDLVRERDRWAALAERS